MSADTPMYSYRPRNAGHDYYGRGTYLITLVVRGREPLLSRLCSDKGSEGVVLTPLGEAVREAWLQTPERQRQEYYAFVGRTQRPLFDDNYDDTVCLNDRHRQAMIA